MAGIMVTKISVVISTYSKERLRYLSDCIISLKNQSLKPDEIILVLDPFPDLIEFYESRFSKDALIVVSEKPGLSNARNAGIKNANGDLICFLDDDAVADKKWLENLVKNYADKNVVGVGGFIRPAWEQGAPKWFPEELNWIVGCSYKGLPEHKAMVRNPIGCNMSFRKAVFDKAGLFRADIGRFGTNLLASEETEISIRILKNIEKSKIIYDPAALVHHKIPKRRRSLKYVWVRSFYEGLSKAIITDESISSKELATESSYLKYILSIAIPSRLKRIYEVEESSKILVSIFSISAVFAGFVTGKLMRG
jgi:glycosyltransferase involved in cell wall biosynthesis